jgi:hypothetical protein
MSYIRSYGPDINEIFYRQSALSLFKRKEISLNRINLQSAIPVILYRTPGSGKKKD